MNVWGATVTGKVLAATEFRDFLCARYDVTPLNYLKKAAALSNYLYVTDLYEATEALSLHAKMRCTASSSTLLGNPSPITAYSVNPSYTRAAADQRRRHIRRCTYWRHEVTSSFGDYGKSILMP